MQFILFVVKVLNKDCCFYEIKSENDIINLNDHFEYGVKFYMKSYVIRKDGDFLAGLFFSQKSFKNSTDV